MEAELIVLIILFLGLGGYGIYLNLVKKKKHPENRQGYTITAELKTTEHSHSSSSAPRQFYVNVDSAIYTFDSDQWTARQTILKKCHPGDKIMLSLANTPMDDNMVKVSLADGEQIGWLSRTASRAISKMINAGKPVESQIYRIDISGNKLECKISFNAPSVVSELENYYDTLNKT